MTHRFLVLSEDSFLIHAGSQPAFRIPAPRAEELVPVLVAAGYQVSRLTYDEFCGGLTAAQESAKLMTLVMPYGGFYPKGSWPSIEGFLRAGGNFFSLGGCPFAREVEKKGKVWPAGETSLAISSEIVRLRSYNVAGHRRLRCAPGWEEILGFDQADSDAPGVGIEASYVAAGGDRRNRDVLYPLEYVDRFGSLRGHNCVITRNYESAFGGSTWVVVGSLPPEVSGWRELVGGLARYIARGGRIRKLRGLPLACHPGERVVIDCELEGSGTGENLELEIELWDSEDRRMLLSRRRTVSLPAGTKQLLQEDIKTDPAWEDFVHVKLRMRAGSGEVLDFAEAGWVVAGKPSRSECRPIALSGGRFRVKNRPTLLLGANYFVTGTGLNAFKEDPPISPLHWKRNFEKMRDCGLNSVRAFIPRLRLTGDGTRTGELVPGRFRANVSLFHLMMRMGITPLVCAHSAHTFTGRDPRADLSVRDQQQEWTQFCVKEFEGLPVLWDLENEDGIHRFVFKLEDDRTSYEPNKFLEAEWNRWLRENLGEVDLRGLRMRAGLRPDQDLPLPPIDRQSFDDLLERSWRYFAATSFRDWIEVTARAVRQVDPSLPITYSHWQDAFYEMYARWSRETNGDPWFTHDALDFNCIHIYWYEFSEFGNELLLNPVALVKYISGDSLGKPGVIGETGVSPPGGDDNLAAFVEEWFFSLLAGGGQGIYFWTWDEHLALSSAEGFLERVDHTLTKGGSRFRHFAFLAKQLTLVEQDVEVFMVVSTAAKIGGQPETYVRCIIEAMETLFATGAEFQLIADKDLDRLPERARVLIVPSPLCMNDSTWSRIKDFLANGGNVYISGFFDRDEWRRPTQSRPGELLGEAACGLSSDELRVVRKQVGKGTLIFVTQAIEYLRGQESTFLRDAEKRLAISPPSARDFYAEIIGGSGIPMVEASEPAGGVLIFPHRTSRGRLFVVRNRSRWPHVHFGGISISGAGEYALVEVAPGGITLAEALSVSEGEAGESLIEVASPAGALVISQDEQPIRRSKVLVIKLKEPGSAMVKTEASWEKPVTCIVRFDRNGCCLMQSEPASIADGRLFLRVPDDLTEYAWLVTEEDRVHDEIGKMEANWLMN